MTFDKAAAMVLAASLLTAGMAQAGDFAAFQSLGFSPDGKVFAFEEYGVQDGSGFPYSNIYFIDTQKDAFLSGTPIRVRIDSEEADLSDARADSGKKAAPLIAAHKVAANPGVLTAFNPMGEIGVDRTRIRYHQYAVEPNPSGEFVLQLDEIDLPLPQKCADITPDGSKGFRLRFTQVDGEIVEKTVYQDSRVPDSRNCPLSYQLSGVMTFHAFQHDPVHVALVLVRSYGFEGSDGRWIAVPVRP
jgi:predicted secreted protein